MICKAFTTHWKCSHVSYNHTPELCGTAFHSKKVGQTAQTLRKADAHVAGPWLDLWTRGSHPLPLRESEHTGQSCSPDNSFRDAETGSSTLKHVFRQHEQRETGPGSADCSHPSLPVRTGAGTPLDSRILTPWSFLCSAACLHTTDTHPPMHTSHRL